MIKEKLNFYIITVFSLIVGIMIDYLFYGKIIGISFFIFILMTIFLALLIAKRFEQKINKLQIALLISAIILSAEVFLKSNSFLSFFNIIGSIYLLILAAILFIEKDFFNTRFLRYFTAPISFVLKSFSGSSDYINSQKNLAVNKEKLGSKELRGVFKGVIMALPILAVLGWFLYSADLVVQAYANKLFDLFYIKINLELILRILIIFVFSFFFIGVFSKISGKNEQEKSEEQNNQIKSTGFIESMTVLTLVELLFLAFIAIQFFYLFGGKNYVWGIDEYITYSEYAKNGFFELIAVAIISFLLIYTIAASSKIESLKEKKIFRFLSALLFVEITIILLSALKRLLLYIDGYGLTLSRFLAFALLFWIFSVFFLILYKIFLEKKNSAFIFMVFSLSVAVWIGINIINPFALIARVNIERLAQGKKLDPYYFSNLPDDAIPEIVKIFKLNLDDGRKATIAMGLNWKYALRDYNCDVMPYNNAPYFNNYGISQCKPILFSEKIKTIKKSPWQSFNLSEENALQALKDNAKEIDKYEIIYWKNAIIECKKGAAQCEDACVDSTWQANDSCKITCGMASCEEFENNIKQYE